ncbi:MAG TPA: arylsulfatase [Oscillospiraceae bacterium]|nr:arylsulfatase [Oscillospiraceae bacterium]HPF56025.1 arylsulfatase [Clostridiales bacterium]HPK35515.1 arylsulfatase [Oscillospiraceae bacterium]HPR75650.1 arylsulfatase [Oscillospiraceae bacterium]
MKNETGSPNIIYILADDMGYGDLSCLNENSKIHTPNFDRLADSGMAFTDAHASSAVCTPSRYSVLTGRYNWRSRLKHHVLGGYSPSLIEQDRLTVADMLREKGYKTACIGKWHLGLNWGTTGSFVEEPGYRDSKGIDFSAPIKGGPCDHGFDYYFGISASLDMPPYVYIENEKVTQLPDHETESPDIMRFWRLGPTAPDFKHEQVLPKVTEKALDIIEKWADKPFFLYFPLPAPHAPILPIGEFVGKSKTNSYGDFVLMCDDVVGQVMEKLKQLNLTDNTIVIYTSDNGCSHVADLKALAQLGHNPSYIFRGHKADIYEGGHRIPLLVSWPGKIQPGSTSAEPVCLIDLMATVADIVGYQLPENAGEDSVSNLPVWLGETYQKPLREATVHHSIDGSFSIRKGQWKLELCPGSGGWSYPRPGEEPEGSPSFQLYDLDSDIAEKVNVIADHPEIVEELKALLTQYITQGRSTPGTPQSNTGPAYWEQLHWMA